MKTVYLGSRVDYLRFRIPEAVDLQFAYVERFTEAAAIAAEECGLTGKFSDISSTYNFSTKRFEKYLNVWGEPAAHVFEDLTPTQTKMLMRVDYRTPCEGEQPSSEDVFAAMSSINEGRKRKWTLSHYNSPIREKRGGRDAGGKTCVSGGKDSDKRLSYYQRGKEGPALEIQIQGAALQNILQSAYNHYLESDEGYVDTVRKHLWKAKDELCRERIGCSADVLTDGKWAEQEVIGTSQENFLSSIDAIWHALSEPAKQSFVAAHLEEFQHISHAELNESGMGGFIPAFSGDELTRIPFEVQGQDEDDLTDGGEPDGGNWHFNADGGIDLF